jgi:hypothetical protein
MRTTVIALAAILVAGAVADACLYYVHGWTGTFSFLVLRQSRRYPIIALLIGVLIGHLFWPQPEPPPDPDPDPEPHRE